MSKSLGRIVAVALLASASAVPLSSTSALATDVHEVTVDIRPGSTDKNLNLKGKATLPVALLSTPSFDATTVLVETLCFGDPDNKQQRDCTEEHGTGHPSDVDGDGDTDLLLHYASEQAGFDHGDGRACIEGNTAGGGYVFGCDEIAIQNGTAETQLPDFLTTVLAEPTLAEPHASVTWTATILNEGLGASTVWPGTDLVKFVIPAELTGAAVTAPAGYACTTAATAATCAPSLPDTIEVGATRVFTLTGVVPDVPGPVKVEAIADPDSVIAEIDETDNAAFAISEVQVPNFAVAMVADPAAASPGDHLAWKTTLTNTGPSTARVAANVALLRFTVPAGLTNPTVVAPAGFSCAATTGGFLCTTTQLVTLAVNQTLDFALNATAPATAGLYEVQAVVDPSNLLQEADETDNTVDAAILVQLPNLIVSSVVSPELVGPNETVEWVATVSNAGPGRASFAAGDRVVRLLASSDLAVPMALGPAGFTCTLVSPREAYCTSDAAVTLNPGDERVFRLRGQIPSGTTSLEVVATADPANAVAEHDETDNQATSTATVRVSDLAVAMTVTPNPVDASHTVTWTATVTNTGTSAIDVPTGTVFAAFSYPAGMLNLFAATPTNFSCYIAGTLLVECATTAAVSVPAGTSLELRLGGTAPRNPGDVTTSVAIDPNNVITEENETNNSASIATTVRPPDFSVTMSATPDPVDALSSSTWNITVTNDGPARARVSTNVRVIRITVPANMVNLAMSSPANFTCFIEAALTVDCQTTASMTLDAGASWSFTLFGTAPRQPGEITTTVAVDPLDVIPEADEFDNSASATITVQPPDFSISLGATPDPVDALSSSTWTAVITNDGPANARITNSMRMIRFIVPANMVNLAVSSPANFTCFIEAPQTVDCQSTTTQNLAAGNSYTFTMFGTVPRQPGPISMTVTADPLGLVPEADETDNSDSATITVQPPDFSVSLTATPDPVDAAHSSTWTAVVTNDGPANARITNSMRMIRFNVPANMVNLAVSSPANFTCFIEAPQTVDCQSTTTQNLAAGSSYTFTMFGTAPRQGGPISMTVTADPLGLVPEADEADNSASETITVQMPDFSVAVAAPATAQVGDQVTYTTTVTNDGPAVARLSASHKLVRISYSSTLTGAGITAPAGWNCVAISGITFECNPDTTTSIPVGASLDFVVTGTASAAGDIVATASADPGTVIPEVDESDNAASRTVTVS